MRWLRRSTRAIQIIDADHILERLDEAERSFCLDPYPIGLVCVPVACVVRRTQSPLHRATRRHGGDALFFKVSAAKLSQAVADACRILASGNIELAARRCNATHEESREDE
jgi:hypothetical protein